MRWKAKRTKNIESYLCNLKPKFKSNFCGLFRNNKSASLHSCTILHITLVGRPTQLSYISDIYLFVDDQHRNTNMNDEDHLVGQLTTPTPTIRKMSIDLRHFCH